MYECSLMSVVLSAHHAHAVVDKDRLFHATQPIIFMHHTIETPAWHTHTEILAVATN